MTVTVTVTDICRMKRLWFLFKAVCETQACSTTLHQQCVHCDDQWGHVFRSCFVCRTWASSDTPQFKLLMIRLFVRVHYAELGHAHGHEHEHGCLRKISWVCVSETLRAGSWSSDQKMFLGSSFGFILVCSHWSCHSESADQDFLKMLVGSSFEFPFKRWLQPIKLYMFTMMYVYTWCHVCMYVCMSRYVCMCACKYGTHVCITIKVSYFKSPSWQRATDII